MEDPKKKTVIEKKGASPKHCYRYNAFTVQTH